MCMIPPYNSSVPWQVLTRQQVSRQSSRPSTPTTEAATVPTVNLGSFYPKVYPKVYPGISFPFNSTPETSSRAVYFMEAVTELKNNKSRRAQAPHEEAVKAHRKWLGGVKVKVSFHENYYYNFLS